MALPLIAVAMLVATVVLITLLPVAITVSYFFARGIRQRLDLLLDATHATPAGKHGMQIEVSGEDEIVRLQTDFNGMVTALKINMEALRDEREKVATLLTHRRELMAIGVRSSCETVATVSAYLESTLRQRGLQVHSE